MWSVKGNNFIFTVTLWRQDDTSWPVIISSSFCEGALSSWQRSYRQCDIQMSLPCHISHTLRVLYPLQCKQSDWWVQSSTHWWAAWFKSKWGVPVPIQLIASHRHFHIGVRQSMTIPLTYAEQDDPSRNTAHLYLGGACIISQLTLLMFLTSLLISCRQIPQQCLKLGDDFFVLNLLQFVIHQQPFFLLHSPSYWHHCHRNTNKQ